MNDQLRQRGLTEGKDNKMENQKPHGLTGKPSNNSGKFKGLIKREARLSIAVPTATKSEWVLASRRQGFKSLTDWIISVLDINIS